MLPLLGSLAACAAPPPTEPTAHPVETAIASSVSSAASAPSAAPSAPVVERPIRTSTPGKIACGSVDCDLGTEVCCADAGTGRCVAKTASPTAEACGPKEAELRCDEGADCARGEACCRRVHCGPDQSPCVDPDADDACTSYASCVPSSQCYSGDLACLPHSTCSNGPCEGDRCPAAAAALPCGGVQCAPHKTCCWDPVAGKGTCECSETAPPAGRLAVFACESPSGCGAGYGCFNSSGTPDFRVFHCGQVATSCTRVVDGPYLCEKLADCPPLVVGDTSTGALSTLKATGCRHDAEDPPTVKRCVYP